MSPPRLGAHMSISGGPAQALHRGQSIYCDTIQMFTRSNARWQSKDLTDEQIQDFAMAREETGIWPIAAHGSYLINLGSPDDALWHKSIQALVIEIERCRQLDIADYVLHPGSHGGAGEEAGLARIASGMIEVLARTPQNTTRILLETTAGQGASLGYRFEQLAWLLDKVHSPARMGICLDTAHVFAAGYDLRTPESYADTWQQFEEIIGIGQLRAIHLNDSKRELASHVDRHEHIGQGTLGAEAFAMLVNDRRLRHIPMILETPKDARMSEDVANLTLLRELVVSDNDEK